jgi:hypothetical protein
MDPQRLKNEQPVIRKKKQAHISPKVYLLEFA